MSEPLIVELPGSLPRALSPNGRAGWAERHRHAQQWRRAAVLTTVSELNRLPDGPALRLALRTATTIDVAIVVGLRKGAKTADSDNCLAQCKAALDGIAEGIGVNDRVFRFAPVEQRRSGGAEGYVMVRLQVGEEAA